MYIFLYTRHFFYFFLLGIQKVKFTKCGGGVVILNLILYKVFQLSSSNTSFPTEMTAYFEDQQYLKNHLKHIETLNGNAKDTLFLFPSTTSLSIKKATMFTLCVAPKRYRNDVTQRRAPLEPEVTQLEGMAPAPGSTEWYQAIKNWLILNIPRKQLSINCSLSRLINF